MGETMSDDIILSLKIRLTSVQFCLVCGTSLEDGDIPFSPLDEILPGTMGEGKFATPINHILSSSCFSRNSGNGDIIDIQLFQNSEDLNEGGENTEETSENINIFRVKLEDSIENEHIEEENVGTHVFSEGSSDEGGSEDESKDTKIRKLPKKDLALERYNCDKCDAFFTKRDNLTWHCDLVHEQITAFPCSICNLTFDNVQDLMRHSSNPNGHTGREFSCFVCGKQVRALSFHLESHIGDRKHHCTQCGLTFVQKASLRKHILSHNEGTFECHLCKDKFMKGDNLRYHLRNTHKQNKCFQCKICSEWMETYDQVVVHTKEIHGSSKLDKNPQKSPCQYCGEFVSHYYLKKHIKTQHPTEVNEETDCDNDLKNETIEEDFLPEASSNLPLDDLKTKKESFPCNNCGKVFGRRNENEEMVNNHLALCGTNLPKLKTDLQKEIFQCQEDECDAFFKSEERLQFHNNLLHSDDSPNLQCPCCDDSFQQNWTQFNKHFNKFHKNESTLFKCQLCGAQLKGHLDVIKLHYKYHAGLREHSCVACGSSFMESKTLREHERQHLGTQDIGTEKKITSSCEHCGKQMLKRNLKYHIDTVHMGIRQCQDIPKKKPQHQFSCLVCDHKTKSSWLRLVEHFDIHKVPTLENLSCQGFRDCCGCVFSSLLDLHKHFYTVHRKGVECPICHMVVKNKAYYDSHMAGHSSLKTCHCSYCPKSFKTKVQLDIHEMRHTGQGKFECSICGKRFPQKGEVRNHEMQHGSEKGFTCDHCGKSFTRDAYLRIHMKTHFKKDGMSTKSKNRYSQPVESLIGQEIVVLQPISHFVHESPPLEVENHHQSPAVVVRNHHQSPAVVVQNHHQSPSLAMDNHHPSSPLTVEHPHRILHNLEHPLRIVQTSLVTHGFAQI